MSECLDFVPTSVKLRAFMVAYNDDCTFKKEIFEICKSASQDGCRVLDNVIIVLVGDVENFLNKINTLCYEQQVYDNTTLMVCVELSSPAKFTTRIDPLKTPWMLDNFKASQRS